MKLNLKLRTKLCWGVLITPTRASRISKVPWKWLVCVCVVGLSLIAGTAITSAQDDGSSSTQDGPTLTANPSSVEAAGKHTFTVIASGFTAAPPFTVLPCDMPASGNLNDVDASTCDQGNMAIVAATADGGFTTEVTLNVPENGIVIGAGDFGQTESASVAITVSKAGPAVVQGPYGDEITAQVRIVARKLVSGRVEFGLQVAQRDGSWGNRLLPRIRYFPPDARVDRWLSSSSLSVGTGTARITARKLVSGRVEFGLQVAQRDGSWGDRLLPRSRYFPPNARVERWLTSSPLTFQLTSTPDHGNSNRVPEASDLARDVLATLYRSTNGDNWTNNQNWLTDKPLNTWYGITTNARNQIVSIKLHNNQLTGMIPAELSKLTHLTELWLYDNQLSGTIPAEFSKLTNLTELLLSGNKLTGPLETPKELVAETGDGYIDLKWDYSEDIDYLIASWEYRIKVASQKYSEWIKIMGGADVSTHTVSNLQNGMLYWFEVRAVNQAGVGPATKIGPIMPCIGQAPCVEWHQTIARQNAVIALANRYSNKYRELVNTACATVEGYSACGGEMLSVPGYPPANDGGLYYSGVITGPYYCASRSFGGPTTYPLDSDGDGVADACVMPYTRREATARQMAGNTLAAMYLQEFKTILTDECHRLSGTNYSDNPTVEVCSTYSTKYLVPVYFCAPAGRYSQSNMASIVADLDSHVHRFYDRESSGLAEVRLTLGGVISPNIKWDTLFDDFFYKERTSLSRCELEAIDAADDNTQILVLMSMQTHSLGGWARYDIGPAVASLHASGGPEHGGFHEVVAHELGHSLFGLDHTDDDKIRVVDCSEVEWSLMNSFSDCKDNISQFDKLDYYQIICSQRQQLGWPCIISTPALAEDTPRSYKKWKSYSSTSFVQKGVRVRAIRQNIPGSSDNTASIYVACHYRDTEAEWVFFLSINWGGVAFTAPTSNGDFTMSIRFPDKSLLEVEATESNNDQFSAIPSWGADTRQLAQQIIANDGQNMTWFAYDSQDRLFSATFDTTGSAVAVQSVLNFCDAQQ